MLTTPPPPVTRLGSGPSGTAVSSTVTPVSTYGGCLGREGLEGTRKPGTGPAGHCTWPLCCRGGEASALIPEKDTGHYESSLGVEISKKHV